MKVLLVWELVWEEVPERTTLYSLEGELAELAIKSAGYYINAEECSELTELNDRLNNLEPLGHAQCHEAYDISNHDKVVICGFIA